MDSVILILCYVAISIIFMKYLTDIWDEIVTWCYGGVEPGPGIETITYGLLYNWYAAADERNICAAGWHIPTNEEWNALLAYLGADAGGKMKEAQVMYWNNPNTGATNEVWFNGKGAGYRGVSDGLAIYTDLKKVLFAWSVDEIDIDIAYALSIGNYLDATSGLETDYKYIGYSLRLIKDSTTLTHGQTGTMTGNDGKVYRTICIGTQEWVADNLAETKYRDGSDIPNVTDNAAWAALTTGARCAYNNDNNNV